MRFVINPKDDLRVKDETTSKLLPEFLELLRSGSVGVGSITDNTSGERSIGSITVDVNKSSRRIQRHTCIACSCAGQ